MALKFQSSGLSGHPLRFSLSSQLAAAGAPTEVLSCQCKCLVKPLVDKASGQIGSSLPAPHPHPAPPPTLARP